MTNCGMSAFASLLGVKQTWPIAAQMSACDPERTLLLPAPKKTKLCREPIGLENFSCLGGCHAHHLAGHVSLYGLRVAAARLGAGAGSDTHRHSQRSGWALCRCWRRV